MERLSETRRASRNTVDISAKCQTQTGVKGEGVLSDISAQGCCVTTRTLYLSEGARLMIRPKGLEGLSGIVRWVKGQSAGVEFDSPLYGPVVEHLAAVHGSGQPVSIIHH